MAAAFRLDGPTTLILGYFTNLKLGPGWAQARHAGLGLGLGWGFYYLNQNPEHAWAWVLG
jgi:hypothetical protein